MNFIYNNRTRNLRWLPIGIFVLTLLFVAEVEVYAQTDIVAAASESVIVYPIAVAVNKSVVLRLPRRATRVAVTSPRSLRLWSWRRIRSLLMVKLWAALLWWCGLRAKLTRDRDMR